MVRSLSDLPKQKVWIIKPVEGLSTPAVYKQLNLGELKPRDPEKYLKNFVEGSACHFNDLEDPAFELMPELLKCRDGLLAMGFEHVLLSGSGTAFACFGDEASICVPEGHAYFQSPAHFINRSADNWY